MAWLYGVGVLVIALATGAGVHAALRSFDGCSDAYASTATIRVESLPRQADLLVAIYDFGVLPARIAILGGFATSTTVLDMVGDKLRGASPGPAADFTEEALRERISVRVDGLTIQVRAVEDDPALAQRIARADSEVLARFVVESEPTNIKAPIAVPATYSKDKVVPPAFLCD